MHMSLIAAIPVIVSIITLVITIKIHFGRDAKRERELNFLIARLSARKTQQDLQGAANSGERSIEAVRKDQYVIQSMMDQTSYNLQRLSGRILSGRTYIIGLSRWRRMLLAYRPTLDKATYLDRAAYWTYSAYTAAIVGALVYCAYLYCTEPIPALVADTQFMCSAKGKLAETQIGLMLVWGALSSFFYWYTAQIECLPKKKETINEL